jgi:phosphatidylglycerol:prolipoprotein diacylglycerol transferase
MVPFLSLSRSLVLDSWYVMLVAGIALGSLIPLRILSRQIGWGRSLLVVAIMVWAAMFGAHLLHAALHPQAFHNRTLELLIFWKGGHSFLGALALAPLVLLLLSRILPGLCFLAGADAFALGIPVGLVFARIGCHLKGCCWGTPLPEIHPLQGISRKLVENHLLDLHPVQLYSAAGALLLFLVLVFLGKRCRSPGVLSGAFAFLYGAGRFFLEFFRGDSAGQRVFGGLSIHQGLSLVLVAAAIGFLVLLRPSRTSSGCM